MGMWGLWARELQLAQEQQANPTPLSFTAHFPAWAWGEFGSRVSELRPCAMADRSGGKHTVWTCPDRLAHPLTMQPPRALVLLLHNACAVPTPETGHTEPGGGGPALRLPRVPSRGPADREALVCHGARALPLVPSLELRFSFVPGGSEEQAQVRSGVRMLSSGCCPTKRRLASKQYGLCRRLWSQGGQQARPT